MSNKKIYFNRKMLKDTSLSDDTKMQTAVCLKKSTLQKIEDIKSKLVLISNRPQVIEAAVNYFHDYVFSGQFDEMKEFVRKDE